MNEVATDKWKPVYDFVENHCVPAVAVLYAGRNFLANNTYFRGGDEIFVNPVVRVSDQAFAERHSYIAHS